MNEREKIIQAIEGMNAAEVDLREAEVAVIKLRKQLEEAKTQLCKTLHAVQGDRCEQGVLFKGKRYSAKHMLNGRMELETAHVECEVLG